MTSISIPGYQVTEELYNGSRTLVYRGYRENDSLPVVIKLLKNPYPSFSELLSFRNQYTIAKNLNSPLIVQTYSLELYQNGYALVMEDFGGISLKEWGVGGSLQSLQEFLLCAIALCNILDILYRQRIIHKDIKPSNILINPETKQLKLIDFSIASLLSWETQTLISPNILEGTLAYISPEQTGRMNRGIDYRTDFYSVGVTFYELLTGVLPFQSNDPMELVHCHIAFSAPLVNEINPQIPSVLGDIVSKLMAKNAEDRYQSALGLKFDLENCLIQLQETGIIKSFEIAQRDVCDRFLIKEKLYGRESQVQTLLEAFGHVANGGSELMLVTGFSGIGKTAVVNEVHKPIVRWNGYFIKGKYDQFNRNIPLSAFVQAFRDLMGQLLSESDTQLQQWQSKILAAVGENGQVLIEVIPELEQIIGKQPAIAELSGSGTQNRFNLLFQKFIQVFTTPEHPLVMFLDDLQWADSASLNLLKLLMSQSDGGYLLIIGAYRDNEVFAAHPLILTLDEIEKASSRVNTLTLSPLSQADVNHLIADSLCCATQQALPLTKLVYQKAKGNPFFTTQFLKALHEDGLITFDWEAGFWQCDVAKVRSLALTDDVVEFMAQQLQKLPDITQDILKLAACVGNQFDLETLAIVSEKSQTQTASDLWKALQEGFIIPTNEIYKFYQDSSLVIDHLQRTNDNGQRTVYKFLHDRVQQAAYFLIPDNQKQTTHYQIGQLLLQQISAQAREDRIFEIVNQLNYGTALITQQTEREELAQLNLIACRKARSATAYQAGREYASTGLSLLGEQAWQQQYEMSLAFHELAAEVAMLCGDFEAMEKFIDIVTEQVHSLIEQVNVYRIRIQGKTSQRQLNEVLAIGINILQKLGANITESPTPADIQKSIQEISELIGDRQIADFVYLPVMTDANKIAITQIASSIMAAAYTCGSLLYPLLATLLVKLFLRHGNISVSATNYACYSLVLCNMQNIDLAAQFGKLALNVAAKFDDKENKLEVFFLLGSFILHRKSHLKEMLPLLSESYTLGLEVGNLEYAGYAVHNLCLISSWCGQPLANLEEDTRTYYHALVQLKQLGAANYCLIYWQVISNLLGLAEHPTILSGSAFQETEFLPLLQSANDICGLYIFYSYKLMLCFLFGEVEPANNYAFECRNYLMSGAGTVAEPAFYFYDSLVALALLSQPSWEVSTVLERVAENQTKLQHWADYAPMNHQHKVDLVEAEKCRILGQKSTAIDLYDKAILGAKENEYIQEEALANELAAKFYLNWDKEKLAQIYMQEAYYCYARWGAKAKVANLEKRYPQLLAPILQQTRSPFSTNETIFTLGSVTSTCSATSSSSSISVALDLAAILKASQTLSGEIELEKLLSVLLHIVIENAGANKCIFMLLESDRLLIQASAQLSLSGVENQAVKVDFYPMLLNPQPVEDSVDVPVGLINTVKRSLQPAVITNATVHPQLINDPYIQRQQPKSILCSPILRQGKLLGILYLENNLATGAFTSDRVDLLNLLCAQAAISLENARLYRNSQNFAQQLQQSLAKLQASETRFQNLANNIPGMVYQFHLAADGSTSIPYVSSGCFDLYGLQPQSVMAGTHSLYAMHHPDDDPAIAQAIAYSAENLTPFEQEWRIILPSGSVKWIQSAARPERQADGAILWDGVVIDISDRKQAELALQQKSQDLQKALNDLQHAQLQIVQSEKMSALGNLVAGVAHEMNNPLGFIAASLKQAKPTIADIVEHLKLYQSSLPNASDEIKDHAEEIDLDYSLEDLPKIIDSMTMACDRLKNISTSLRTFSRADKEYKVPFNIHEGIDSTILILKHRLKANEQRPAIEVITNYGNLPQIECFPGQLNQVFINILANAIDALEESNNGRSFEEIKVNPNHIYLQTSLTDNEVKIVIADNGIGMDEQVKQKIFDHLFTTKAVGKGTGLGMAIAQQIIVEKHNGTLTVNSTFGEGTEFVITLPKKRVS